MHPGLRGDAPSDARCRFIVVGLQRSGTTVTERCLKGHPEVSCASEEIYVSPFFTRGVAAFTGGGEPYAVRGASHLALFDAITSLEENTFATGLKVAINSHDDAIDFARCVRDNLPGVKIILVDRTDMVAQYASLRRAEHTGEWHARVGDGQGKRTMLRIEPSEFADHVRLCARAMAQLRTLGATHELFELSYERDIAPATGWDRLFEFLGVTRLQPTWLVMRKVAPPASTYVENYDELRAVLDGIPPADIDAERAAARERLRRTAADEHPEYLLSRALESLRAGCLVDAYADAVAAVESERNVDRPPWFYGKLCAVFEATASTAPLPSPVAHRFEALMEQYAGVPNFRLSRAEIGLESGRVDAARADVVETLLQDGELGKNTLRWGLRIVRSVLRADPDPERSEQTLRDLAGRFGGESLFLLHRAEVRLELGRREEAMADIVAVLCRDADPELDDANRRWAFRLLGNLLWHAGDPASGDRALAEIGDRHADEPDFRLQRAWYQLRHNRVREVHADLVAALLSRKELDENGRRWAFEMLETAWTRMGDAEVPRTTIAALEERHADSPFFSCLKGLVLYHLGQRDSGLELLRQTAERAPEHDRARQLLAQLRP